MPSRIVISDASPLNYPIPIDHADILPALYAEVLIPESVAEELRHAAAPDAVRSWVDKPPSWLRIRPAVEDPAPLPLQDSIVVSVMRSSLPFICERICCSWTSAMVSRLRKFWGSTTTGTLGVLVRASPRTRAD